MKKTYRQKVRSRLPYPLRAGYDTVADWCKYVLYQRWYKIKLVGMLRFLTYTLS